MTTLKRLSTVSQLSSTSSSKSRLLIRPALGLRYGHTPCKHYVSILLTYSLATLTHRLPPQLLPLTWLISRLQTFRRIKAQKLSLSTSDTRTRCSDGLSQLVVIRSSMQHMPSRSAIMQSPSTPRSTYLIRIRRR